jgi:hypothetical protein
MRLAPTKVWFRIGRNCWWCRVICTGGCCTNAGRVFFRVKVCVCGTEHLHGVLQQTAACTGVPRSAVAVCLVTSVLQTGQLCSALLRRVSRTCWLACLMLLLQAGLFSSGSCVSSLVHVSRHLWLSQRLLGADTFQVSFGPRTNARRIHTSVSCCMAKSNLNFWGVLVLLAYLLLGGCVPCSSSRLQSLVLAAACCVWHARIVLFSASCV